MKIIALFLSLQSFSLISIQTAQAQSTPINADKTALILNAVSLSEVENEQQFFEHLTVSCERNHCTVEQKQDLVLLGRKMIYCQLPQLKQRGIDNRDAKYMCRGQQAMLTCDSLSTSLMRQMCYTANKHSLQILGQKEQSFKNRLPASNN
jgi:hypothetical protein